MNDDLAQAGLTSFVRFPVKLHEIADQWRETAAELHGADRLQWEQAAHELDAAASLVQGTTQYHQAVVLLRELAEGR